jgi:alcohol dehydrogenase class IV
MERLAPSRDLCHGEETLETLKTLKGKEAVVLVGGEGIKHFGFLDKAIGYLKTTDMDAPPDTAVIDSELALLMPPKFTAHTGIDAITHAIDTYIAALLIRTLLCPVGSTMEKLAEIAGGDACADANPRETPSMEIEKVLRYCFYNNF